MLMVGDKVQITPTIGKWREFFAFVDGWTGTVTGANMGNLEVKCTREDGVKTFYVPADCLTKIKDI